MRHSLAIALGLLLIGSVALADGSGPERKMTEAEAASFKNVREVVQSALPKVPDGYTFTFEYVSDFTEGMIAEAVAPDGMFRMSWLATYTLDPSLREARQRNFIMDKTKGTPEQQAKLAVLDAKEAELRRARDQATSRAEKDKIRAEMKAVQAQADAIRDEIAAQIQAWITSGSPTPTPEEIDKSLPPDLLTLEVTINARAHVSDKATPYAIEGFPLAFEQSEECDTYDRYCISVLIGPFEKMEKVTGAERFDLKGGGAGVPTKARGMSVVVNGPKGRQEEVREFLRAVDLAKLKSLLS